MFQDRIRENYENLTPGFRRLADFMMNNTLDAAFLTATELSRRVDVDPATVVRFAQELDYSGYRELSIEIKHYVRDQITSSYRKAGQAQTTEELLLSLIESAGENMQHFTTTDLSSVIKAIDILKNAAHIWLTGEAANYDIASFLAQKFRAYGVPADAFHPSMDEIASTLSSVHSEDVLVAIVGSMPSLDVGHAIQLAHQKGVQTIAVTNSGVLLPARKATLTIIVPGKTPIGVPTFGTLMQVLALIWEAVIKERITNLPEKIEEQNTHLKQLLKLRTETPEYELEASVS